MVAIEEQKNRRRLLEAEKIKAKPKPVSEMDARIAAREELVKEKLVPVEKAHDLTLKG